MKKRKRRARRELLLTAILGVALLLAGGLAQLLGGGTAGAATPLGKHAQELYQAFDAAGNGGVDFSGIIQHVRSLAGKA